MPVEGSRGEPGTWKSLGGSEELSSVLLEKKRESKQYLILERKHVSRSAPTPLQSHPHPAEGPGSPQLCGFSSWAVRSVGTWAISAPRSGRCQAPRSLRALVGSCRRARTLTLSLERGQDAWLGPGGVLGSSWAAEEGWMHHV